MIREKILCPRCKRLIAVIGEWAPGYPLLYPHKIDGKKCDVGYLRESKVFEGKWVES